MFVSISNKDSRLFSNKLWLYHYLIWELSSWLFISLRSGTILGMDVCGLRSPSFQSNSALYITIINNTSLQKLVMQGQEERLEKSYFHCSKNTWYLCCKKILQSPKYLIINVNRFSYVGNQLIKKTRSLVPLDLNFMLGSYAFSLQATLTIMDSLSILVIILFLSIVAREHFIAMATKLLYVI